MIRALEIGFPQKEIADSGYRTQLQEDAGERIVVGVNRYVQAEEKPIHYLRIDEGLEREQIERLGAVKVRPDPADVRQPSRAGGRRLPERARTSAILVDAVKAYVSLGEIADVYRQALGQYQEPIIF